MKYNALLISSLTLYFTKIGISPLYIITPILLFPTLLWFYDVAFKHYNCLQIKSSIASICILSLIIVFNTLDSRPQDIYNFAASPFLFFVTVYICRRLSAKETYSVALQWISILLLFFTIEALLRLIFPENEYLNNYKLSESDSVDLIYRYKFASFMFEDSNYVGLQLLIIFCTLLGLRGIYNDKRIFLFLELWCSILICLSYSRASIISLGFVSVIYFLRNSSAAIRFTITVASVFIGFIIYDLIKDDPSFNSKFEIIYETESYFLNTPFFNLLFGSGIGRSIDAIGIGAHNIFVLYTVEAGIIYLALFILLFYSCVKVENLRYIILGFVLNGFSLITYAVPYLYASLGLLVAINLKFKLEIKNSNGPEKSL